MEKITKQMKTLFGNIPVSSATSMSLGNIPVSSSSGVESRASPILNARVEWYSPDACVERASAEDGD
eukprot:13076131-Heterocapsa_arctica.AAC.1